MQIETLDEWRRKHKGNPAVFKDEQHRKIELFVDGAVIFWDHLGGYQLQEPRWEPGSLNELLQTKEYHERKLEEIIEVFDLLKKCLLGQSNYWPKTNRNERPLSSKEDLLYLQEKARPHKEAIEAIDQKIENHPKTIANKKAAERNAEMEELRRAEMDRERRELETISLEN